MIYRLSLRFWSSLVRLGAPFLISRRLKKGLEHSNRYQERYGLSNQVAPNADLIWLHGASVGESLSILPLIEKIALTKPQWRFLITTTTIAAQKVITSRMQENTMHQFIPFDATPWVNRFLDHWKPKAALFVESEIWPNVLCQLNKRGIPITLLNARLSQSSFKNWLRVKNISSKLWNSFSKIYTQSDEFTERFQKLGANSVETLGNIKLLSKELPFDKAEYEYWKTQIGDRPCWVAASTHKGEEEQIFSVHQKLKKDFPNLLTIIAPRHIDRCDEILSKSEGVTISKYTEKNLKKEDILLVNAMSKLGLFYRLTSIAFIGGSLIPQGGHNPLEPSMIGAFPLWGPHFFNVDDMMYLFKGFPCKQMNTDQLSASVKNLLQHPQELKHLVHNLQQRILISCEIINAQVDDLIASL